MYWLKQSLMFVVLWQFGHYDYVWGIQSILYLERNETWVQIVYRNNILKVVAKKGSRIVNVHASNSKEWLTILVCINAIGAFILHYFILKGTYLLHVYVQHYGLSVAINVQENGWITIEIFCDWLIYFWLNVFGGVSKDYNHLLILNSHCSHVSAITQDICITMELDIITIPWHSSHYMHPLDVSLIQFF